MRRSESEAKNAAWWLKLSKNKHLSHKQKEELERLSEQWKAWADRLRTHAFAIIGAPFAEPKPKQPKQPKPKKERKPKAPKPKKPAKKPQSALQEQAKTLQKLHELHKKEGEIARKESEKREAKRKKELRENFERNKRDATKDSYYLLDVVRANRPTLAPAAIYAINDIEGMLPNRPPRVQRVKEASKHLDNYQLAYDLERLWRKWVYFFPNDKALQMSWQTHVRDLAEALSLKNYFNPDKRLS